MRTVRAVGDASIALAVVTMPERFALAEGDDADVVLASLTALVDDAWTPAPRFAPRVDVEPMADAAIVSITAEHTGEQLAALVEALAVARQLVGASFEALEVLHHGDTCAVVSHGVATLTCIRSAIGRDALHARVVRTDRRVDIEIDATAPARPARVRTFDASGEHATRLVHQSAHRLTLQRVAEGLPPAYGVGELNHDLGLARTVLYSP